MDSVPAARKIFDAARELAALNLPPDADSASDLSHENSRIPANLARAIAHWLQHFPRPLVFTNGCFDLLHRGHTDYLERAAALGAALVVGVNSDASVRRQGKGEERPIIPLADRMAVVAALASVDGVIDFAATTPLELIRIVQPDHLVKGGDWAAAEIVGGDMVIARGGQVHSLPLSAGAMHSSTAIIKQIRAR